MSPRLFVLALLLLISLELTHATIYRIDDRSYKVPGGNKYANELNIGYQVRVLFGATRAVLSTFNQTEGEGKKYDVVTLLTKSFNNPLTVASTKGNLIRLNADYLQCYRGDIQEEFAGVVYHEMTHVWQWTGDDMAPRGLINGIADYVRLKSGHASKSWPRKGSGSRWDDGYAVTAYFLEYCNDLKPGFVADLNALMKYSYSEAFFVQLLGKSVHQLWGDYKLAYATRRIPGSKEDYRKPPTRTSAINDYVPLKPGYVPEHDASQRPMEKYYDASRTELAGVVQATHEAHNFRQNDFAETAENLVTSAMDAGVVQATHEAHNFRQSDFAETAENLVTSAMDAGVVQATHEAHNFRQNDFAETAENLVTSAMDAGVVQATHEAHNFRQNDFAETAENLVTSAMESGAWIPYIKSRKLDMN